MLSVHTNYASLVAQNSVNKNNSLLSTAMERLSTGLRINSAADDAAGLQIATRLNANVIGMKTANRNVSDATSMLQTADGAMDELTKIADRQKELATQSANGVNSAKDRAAISAESKELAAESKRIVDNTTYAGNNLFSTIQNVTFQIGAGGADKLDVKVTSAKALGEIKDLKLSTQTDANASIAKVDAYLDQIGKARSMLGANINRLQHTAANLHNVTTNTEAAAGRIMDADFAKESAAMTKNQLLVQAGTRVLSRANQNTGLVMGLLG
ncbi:lateral flagellin [Shewanella sp. NFH-SH190041]|uniref:flagellin N-terminal helical domain-containing protein n=1 Tax=Shewanella sp. NFH-SH190041 TaxID=2950245 RepID=UPI0021C37630|nr:flagellin [Shewanella sp. NFH-SH190041]BDM62710.1 lateral flagellin [Shewanella sp. NFH-SH190041]BDM62711.1 lateral flagellin [Shewanella sp. NFH-SH190041]